MAGIKRVLISVYHKEGIVDFARRLRGLGMEIISTGGTQQLLESQGIEVIPVSRLTSFPEILEGRVKTLHPHIHGGILAKRDCPSHQEQLARYGILPIDMVVVNLYPFRDLIRTGTEDLELALENIDIGGPCLIRAAAKNFQQVAVVISQEDYPRVIRELETRGGELSSTTRVYLAQKAFLYTATYDSLISKYLARKFAQQVTPDTAELLLHYEKRQDLRYGENPHQRGYWYQEVLPARGAIRQLQGKELSFNNLLDMDAALKILADFPETTSVIIKHNNPCGVACGITPEEAFIRARQADPLSAFGGIVGFNRVLDGQVAQELIKDFFELIIAPGYTEEALELLKTKTNLRVMEVEGVGDYQDYWWELRGIGGGLLVQERDTMIWEEGSLRVVSRRAPSREEREDLFFAWRVAKHVRSNAIVIAKGGQTIGIGAGQMSRVDSVRLAIMKACLPVRGTVMASDGFFPFRDSIDLAGQAGVTAVVQPGGSRRDKEVIEAADEHNMAMVFTGYRHFRH